MSKPGSKPGLLLSVLLVTITMLFAVGCSSDVQRWEVRLTAAKDLNQNDAGSSLPVVVRVYLLRSTTRFQQAQFKSLWKNDKETLEGDLLERKELTIFPGTKAVVELDLEKKKGAEFIGVMALFRKPDLETWKKVVAVESSSLSPFTPKVKLVLDHSSIRLED